MKVKSLSHVRLFATPWTAAHQAPPSMGFFRPEYWSGVPLPSPLSCVQIFATPWTAARETPLSMGFPRQEYWSELPFPPPGDLPDPGIKLKSPALQTGSYHLSHQGSPAVRLMPCNSFLLHLSPVFLLVLLTWPDD